jgi:hypothetical protein
MASESPTKRHDPVRDRYYKAVEKADAAADWLFYLAAIVSLGVLVVDKTAAPDLYDAALTAFVVFVIVLFVLGLASRLYWTANALDARRRDLLSNAFGEPLTHEPTSGYYNNDETDPLRRLGVAVLEDSLFTRSIANDMLKRERVRSGAYFVLFVVAALYRHWDLAVAGAVAQAVFSEQIISRWLRLEWLRSRSGRSYDGLYALFQTRSTRSSLHAQSLQWVMYYEATKDIAGITLSQRTFHRLNPSLSIEWEGIKKTLKLAAPPES